MPYNITAKSIPLNPRAPGLKSYQPFPEKNKNHPKVGGKKWWFYKKSPNTFCWGPNWLREFGTSTCAKSSKQRSISFFQLALSHISFAWCFRFYVSQSVPFRNFVFRTLFPPATLAATSRRRSVAALLSPSTRLGWTLQESGSARKKSLKIMRAKREKRKKMDRGCKR